MAISKKLCVITLAGLLGVLPTLGFAQTESKVKTAIDSLEVQLEMDRHNQFLETRNYEGSQLAPFTTDGCSGGLSVGWVYLAKKVESFQEVHGGNPPWEACCVTHDRPITSGEIMKQVPR